MKTLVLFDFDGTLTKKDSLNEFLKYSTNTFPYIINMLKFLPHFIKWKFKSIEAGEAKRRLFEIFYHNTTEAFLKYFAKNFSNTKLRNIIIQKRLDIMRKHIEDGHRVIVVSASMRCWLEPWCEYYGVELLSTELEFEDRIFTGNFSTLNCSGPEKERRIREVLSIEDYEKIYAYGNSAGDNEMLALATDPVLY